MNKLIIACALLFLSPFVGIAQNTTGAFIPFDEQVAQQMDSLFAAYDRDDAPGFGIGIIQRGELVYAKGFGIANLDYDIPNTPETVFNIASLSKQFTAACIALLVQQGKVSMDENVQTYIPEFPDYPGPIKVKQPGVYDQRASGILPDRTARRA